ncbi:MAG: hypothetical protein ABR587_03870 [Candidatus Binatia bacterium]
MSSILDAVSRDAARAGAIPGTPGGGSPYPSEPSGGDGPGRFRSAVLVVVFGVALGALAARMFGGDPGGDDLLTEKAVSPVETGRQEVASVGEGAAEPARRAVPREGGAPGKGARRDEAGGRLAAKKKDATAPAAATPPAPEPLVIPAPPASAGTPTVDAEPPTAPSRAGSAPTPPSPIGAPPLEIAPPVAASRAGSEPVPAADGAPAGDAPAEAAPAAATPADDAPVEAAPADAASPTASPVVSPPVPVTARGPATASPPPAIVAGTPPIPPTPGVAPVSPPTPAAGVAPASPSSPAAGLAPASPTSPTVIAGVPAAPPIPSTPNAVTAPVAAGTAPIVTGDADVLTGATPEAALGNDTEEAADPTTGGEVIAAEDAASEAAQADIVYDQRPSGAPEVSILFVAWSRTPADRMASMRIGSGTLSVVHEGEYVEGLQVSAIHPEAVDFQWTGRKFRVPVRPF